MRWLIIATALLACACGPDVPNKDRAVGDTTYNVIVRDLESGFCFRAHGGDSSYFERVNCP